MAERKGLIGRGAVGGMNKRENVAVSARRVIQFEDPEDLVRQAHPAGYQVQLPVPKLGDPLGLLKLRLAVEQAFVLLLELRDIGCADDCPFLLALRVVLQGGLQPISAILAIAACQPVLRRVAARTAKEFEKWRIDLPGDTGGSGNELMLLIGMQPSV